jgi:hypothetical protein
MFSTNLYSFILDLNHFKIAEDDLHDKSTLAEFDTWYSHAVVTEGRLYYVTGEHLKTKIFFSIPTKLIYTGTCNYSNYK